MGSGAAILPRLCQWCPSQLPQLHYMMLLVSDGWEKSAGVGVPCAPSAKLCS